MRTQDVRLGAPILAMFVQKYIIDRKGQVIALDNLHATLKKEGGEVSIHKRLEKALFVWTGDAEL